MLDFNEKVVYIKRDVCPMPLLLNNIYWVKEYEFLNNLNLRIFLKKDSDSTYGYYTYRRICFISLEEFREQKINNLLYG